jgi:hypothetical protein
MMQSRDAEMPCKREEVMLEEGIVGQLGRRRDGLQILEALIQRAMARGEVWVTFTPRGEVFVGDSGAIRAAWRAEPISATAHIAAQVESTQKSTPAVDKAAAWLREALANGPVAAAELVKLAKADGIAERTLQRASMALGVCKEKSGMRGGWRWSIPKMGNRAEDVAEDGQQNGALRAV